MRVQVACAGCVFSAHHRAVDLYAGQLWVRVLGVNGDDDAASCLVPVVSTRHLLPALQTQTDDGLIQQATIHEEKSFSFSLIQACVVTGAGSIGSLSHNMPLPGTCFGTQRCRAAVQPFWSRKALKSMVLMQQQLQYLYLNRTNRLKVTLFVFRSQIFFSYEYFRFDVPRFATFGLVLIAALLCRSGLIIV